MHNLLNSSLFIVALTFLPNRTFGQENIHTYEVNNGVPVYFEVPQNFKLIDNDTLDRLGDNLLPQGEWEHCYANGCFKCHGSYTDGRKEGYWEKRYPNGNLLYQINTHKGFLDGQCKFYYTNGNLKKEGTFKNGLEQGVFNGYSRRGKLNSTIVYLRGKAVENNLDVHASTPQMRLAIDYDVNSTMLFTLQGELVHRKKKVDYAYIRAGENEATMDSLGRFSIQIDSIGQMLYVSLYGYKDQEITIDDTTFLRIELRKEAFWKKKRRGICGFCFSKGTGILMGDNSLKPIEQIAQGDIVLSVDIQDMTIHRDTVLRIDSVYHDNIMTLTFANGVNLRSTTDHPYYVVDKGWCSYEPELTTKNYGIAAKQLRIGDLCLNLSNGELTDLEVVNIVRTPSTMLTYNISKLTTNNTYFANGVLVNIESVVMQKSGSINGQRLSKKPVHDR